MKNDGNTHEHKQTPTRTVAFRGAPTKIKFYWLKAASAYQKWCVVFREVSWIRILSQIWLYTSSCVSNFKLNSKTFWDSQSKSLNAAKKAQKIAPSDQTLLNSLNLDQGILRQGHPIQDRTFLVYLINTHSHLLNNLSIVLVRLWTSVSRGFFRLIFLSAASVTRLRRSPSFLSIFLETIKSLSVCL
jgi:hypothetical protein